MQESTIEIFRAAMNSSKFTPYLNGVDLTLSNGKTVRLKVISSQRRHRPPGFRVSKYSILTKMQINDEATYHIGCGESDIEIIALQKSIAEAIERALFRIFKDSGNGTQTTNGWATHVNLGQAKQSALTEVVERDAVLVHWFTKTPMLELKDEYFPNWLKNWLHKELSFAPRFNTLRIGFSNCGYAPTITTALFDEHGHAVMSHATASTLNGALCKALIETCRIAQGTLTSHAFEESSSLVMGNLSGALSPEHHPLAYAYHLKFPEWFFGEKTDWHRASNQWKLMYRKFLKNPPKFEFKAVNRFPLVTGYCESGEVQNLFFGPTTKSGHFLNLTRIKEVIGEASFINELPHCVG